MDKSIPATENIQFKISELNSKLLAITMTIKDQFSELSKYLEEMPETIPDRLNPKIAMTNLKAYYGTLETLLKNHIDTP